MKDQGESGLTTHPIDQGRYTAKPGCGVVPPVSKVRGCPLKMAVESFIMGIG